MVKEKKKVVKKVVKKSVKKVLKKEELNLFKTTDLKLVYKLQGLGFIVKTVVSPKHDMPKKLYIFNESEKKIKEALNGK